MKWKGKGYTGKQIVFRKSYYKVTGHKGATVLLWWFEMNDLDNRINGREYSYFTLRSLKKSIVILSYLQIMRGLLLLADLDIVDFQFNIRGPHTAVFNNEMLKQAIYFSDRYQ